jgi:hypothetical protein
MPPLAHGHFDGAVTLKIQIFRMANCLLLLIAQLMTAGDLIAYFDHRKLDHGTEIRHSGIIL